ncbi:YgiW/YdeI family stress tolerance OB fold protein [Vibrio sp. TRT 17S01]|uniref:YgiW/YdeI family stress tolerance OB fold protein n=1 Tax=Vibrio sp. TRT 17S01 TaxID=3418505 RepID=UPI003CF83AD8
MKKTTIALAATTLALSTAAFAHNDKNNQGIQFNGPVEVTSIDKLLQDTGMFTEKNVVVEGHVIRQISADKFIFTDGKGEVQIEIDDDISLNTVIDNTTKLRLYGEYEGGNTPEIEVDRLQVL